MEWGVPVVAGFREKFLASALAAAAVPTEGTRPTYNCIKKLLNCH